MAEIHKCDKCSYTSGRISELKSHYFTHTEARPHKCDECSFAAKTASVLKVHMRTHSNEKPFKCKVCCYATKHRGNLKSHMLSHTSEKSAKCNLCSYATARPNYLEGHMLTHNQEKLYKCSQCLYSTNYKQALQRHISVHERECAYKCDQCSYITTNSTAMKTHLRLHSVANDCDVNSGSNSEPIIHYSMGLYKCNRCSYDSVSFKNAQVHMQIHSDRLRADSSKRNYARSELANCPENVMSIAAKSVVSKPSSSYQMSSQSLNKSVNDSVHKCSQYPFANADFRTLQMQMRSRSDRLRADSSKRNCARSELANCPENVMSIAEKPVVPMHSSSSPLSSQSHLNESVNDSTYLRTAKGKNYNCSQYYANASFRTLQMLMRSRSHRHRYSVSNSIYAKPKTKPNIKCRNENVVSAVESAVVPTTSSLHSSPSKSNLQAEATNKIINEIDKPTDSVVANDIVNADFCDVKNREDLDIGVDEQANKSAEDMMFESSIVSENLCYADYTEDDFDFNFDVDISAKTGIKLLSTAGVCRENNFSKTAPTTEPSAKNDAVVSVDIRHESDTAQMERDIFNV